MESEEVLISVAPSPARRWAGIVMLVMLALILFLLALSDPTPPFWRLGFAGIGCLSILGAEALRSATRGRLELTRAELRTDAGEVLARVADVVSVDRGAFAFKPSNGFLLTTREARPRRWAPGLWWRAGRRVGVGGTLSGGQSRAMAELLTALVAGIIPERD